MYSSGMRGGKKIISGNEEPRGAGRRVTLLHAAATQCAFGRFIHRSLISLRRKHKTPSPTISHPEFGWKQAL